MDDIINQQPMGGELPAPLPEVQAVDSNKVKQFVQILNRYKSGKAQTEQRIINSEDWWKLRNSQQEAQESNIMAAAGFKSRSGWLHNVIVSKHADAMEAYPEPNILPREPDDEQEAKKLSDIIPCILEQNEFQEVYSDVQWDKLKFGTGVYKIVWDTGKMGGLGDITIQKVNILNLYWEPGIDDIQKSSYVFHTQMWDKEQLKACYPQLADKALTSVITPSKFRHDDNTQNEDQVCVVDVYYHKAVNGKNTLQYCKFVGDQILSATENSMEPVVIPGGGSREPLALTGLYDHGQYPFVFDPLFPIEGSPCGYGYVDICRNPQMAIDLLKTASIKNAAVAAVPKYFSTLDGNINEEELLDLTKPIVHLAGGIINDTSLRKVDTPAFPAAALNLMEQTVQELRETSGNTETATGNTGSGVTAASAIAALQEASGKGSRDSTMTSYRAYRLICLQAIELVRQFMPLPRQFRIVGQNGAMEFTEYSNKGLQPKEMDYGVRVPLFDIKVSAQKATPYNKMAQNELALQFFQMGFFAPNMATQALACISMMDFDCKDELSQLIQRNGDIAGKLQEYMMLAFDLAKQFAPELAAQMQPDIIDTLSMIDPAMAQRVTAGAAKQLPGQEGKITGNARERSRGAAQPN